ncbi:MAG: hypothetical protein ABSA34_04080 [Candidatus Goldiibacteriota bacterium]|jgi:hypothetical protein
MKKLALVIAAGFLLVSCSSRHNPAVSPFSPAYYTNTGKIKSSTVTTYIISSTTAGTYYYDSSGNIQRIDNTVSSIPSGSVFYQYTGSGMVSFIGNPQCVTQNGNESFSYDSSNRLSVMNFTATYTTTSNDVQTLNYGGDGYVDTINETQNGATACYRVITRDAYGFINREDIYPNPSSTTEFGYITFTRDDADKIVTENIFIGAVNMLTVSAVYDTSGFISQLNYSVGGLPVISQSFVTQSGPFAAAGLNGYYYTDKDLFGLAHDTVNAGSAGQ